MYEPPSSNEFSLNSENTNDEIPESKSTVERAESEHLSVQNVVQHEQKLRTLFLWLIGIGLGLGVVLAIGVGIAMKKFGLTDRPYERQPVQEQIQNDSLENIDIERQ